MFPPNSRISGVEETHPLDLCLPKTKSFSIPKWPFSLCYRRNYIQVIENFFRPLSLRIINFFHVKL